MTTQITNDFAFFAFSHSDAAARPWLEAGYKVLIADVLHRNGLETDDGRLWRLGCDLSVPDAAMHALHRMQGRCVFAGFFPPCTHLAASGSRWWKGKGLRCLQDSVAFFATSTELAEWLECPWFVENPVSAISTHWRKPDYTFDPCDFTGYCQRDNYTKKTCLWTGGGFVMPDTLRDASLAAPDQRIHRAGESKARAALRSVTPEGFARAVFEANRPR